VVEANGQTSQDAMGKRTSFFKKSYRLGNTLLISLSNHVNGKIMFKKIK
jgi:hypothetical protein